MEGRGEDELVLIGLNERCFRSINDNSIEIVIELWMELEDVDDEFQSLRDIYAKSLRSYLDSKGLVHREV